MNIAHEHEARDRLHELEGEKDVVSIGPASPSLAPSGEFTSMMVFEDSEADCLVICCSDHDFRQQNIEFLEACGYKRPHVISIPSGVAVVHSMVASINFLSKAAERLIAKAVESTGVSEAICIAHENCGGYKVGQVDLIGKLARRLAGKPMEEIQKEHVAKAARALSRSFRKVKVRAFFADIVAGENGSKHVRYSEVPLKK